MKRNLRLVIIIGVIIAVLSGAAAVLLLLPQSTNSGISTSETDILLYDKISLHPEEISVKNKSGEFFLLGFNYDKEYSEAAELAKSEQSGAEEAESSSTGVRNVNGVSPSDLHMHYTMQGFEDLELSKSVTDLLAYQCSYVTATRLVDKSGEKYEEYGLDEPVATVKIVFGNNATEILYIGNEAPNDSGRYFRRDGNANVYLAQDASVNTFLLSPLDIFDRTITPEYIKDATIKDITITGSGYPHKIQVNDEEDDYSFPYCMRFPTRRVCSSGNVDAFCGSLFSMEGTQTVAAQPSEEDLEKLKLTDPYMEIRVEDSEGTVIDLLASEKNEDGSCYVMAKGSKLVYRMTESDVEIWYGVQAEDFYADSMLAPITRNISTLALFDGEKKDEYKFEYTRTINEFMKEVLTTAIYYQGETIVFTNMSNLINDITGLHYERGTVKDLSAYQEAARITVTFTDAIRDELVLYRDEKGNFAATLNDNLQGSLPKEYAEELISQFAVLRNKESVKLMSTESEASQPESSEEETSGPQSQPESSLTETAEEPSETSSESREE